MDAAMFHEPRRRMISLPDGQMAALDFGDEKRPVDVVFLHANGFNAMTYRSILAPLSPGLRILAIDQRGHGASRLPTDAAALRSWKIYRDDLLCLLERLDGPAPILAGHSMGGTVSLLASAARPGCASGLVLFDPVILPRLTALMAWAPWSRRMLKQAPLVQGAARRRAVFASAEAAFASYKGRGAFRTWTTTMLADYVAGGFRPEPDGTVRLTCDPAWEAANFASQAHDPWGAAARSDVPVRVFRAEERSTCRIGDGAGPFAHNPKAEVVTVAGASHFLPMERPDLVRDALMDAAV